MLALIPTTAGEIPDTHPDRAPRLGFARLVIAGGAAFQLAAWWINAHHWAGHDSGLFFDSARWTPPPGWALPLLGSILGTALILLGCVLAGAEAGGRSRTVPGSER